jgi:competence protein ComEA
MKTEETSSSTGNESSFLWLRRGDQWFLGGLLCALTVLLGVHWARLHGWGLANQRVQVLTPEGYVYTLDVNQATWVEWAQLDGIGETLARRIVQDRSERGPFASIDDVARVKGIGRKTLERIRTHLRHAGSSAEDGHADVAENVP